MYQEPPFRINSLRMVNLLMMIKNTRLQTCQIQNYNRRRCLQPNQQRQQRPRHMEPLRQFQQQPYHLRDTRLQNLQDRFTGLLLLWFYDGLYTMSVLIIHFLFIVQQLLRPLHGTSCIPRPLVKSPMHTLLQKLSNIWNPLIPTILLLHIPHNTLLNTLFTPLLPLPNIPPRRRPPRRPRQQRLRPRRRARSRCTSTTTPTSPSTRGSPSNTTPHRPDPNTTPLNPLTVNPSVILKTRMPSAHSSVYTMFLLLPGYSEYSPPPFLRESSYNVPEYVKPETKYIAPASTSYLPPLKSSPTTPIPSYHHSLPTSLTPPELRGVGGSSGGVTNIYTTSSDHVPTSTQATIIQTPPGTPIIINLNSNTGAAVSTKELMNMTNTGRDCCCLMFMLDSMAIIRLEGFSLAQCSQL